MKNQLPYEATGTAIKGYKDSLLAKGETNDCVVRAFASCFDISYDKAHKYVKEKFSRKDRQGTYGTSIKMTELASKKTQINYKRVKPVGRVNKLGTHKFFTLDYEVNVKGQKVMRKMTVGTFTKQNPIGTFFIIVKGHAFTIKDGVVIGNFEDSQKLRKPIRFAYQIK
jgi:hypothetical protein